MLVISIAAVVMAPATLTLQSPAHPIKDTLPRLSVAVGQELRADASVMEAVIAFNVREVETETFLKTLSTTLSAAWQRDGKRLVLTRTPALLATLNAADAETQAQWIEPALKRGLPRPKGAPSGLPREAAFAAAVRLGAKTLATVRPGQRLVWSTRANRFQQPLGQPFIALAEREVDRDRERYVALRNRMAEATQPELQSVEETIQSLSRPVDEVHVVVARPFDRNDLAVNMQSFSATGETLQRSRVTLLTPSVTPPSPGEPLHWTPLQADICGRSLDSGDPFPPANVRDALSDPVALDPLEVLVTPHLRQMASGQNWIAWIPDEAYFGARQAFRAKSRTTEFLSTTALTTDTDGSIRVFKPAFPARALLKTPREDLKALISAVAPVGHPTVPSLSRFVNRCPVPFAGSGLANAVLESLYATALYDAENEELRVKNATLAAVLAGFRGPEWVGAGERTVPISALTQAQIDALNQGLLGGLVSDLDRDSPIVPFTATMEPTVLMDQFARSDAIVRASVREERFCTPVRGSQGFTYGIKRTYDVYAKVKGPAQEKRPITIAFQFGCFELDRLSGPQPVPANQVPSAFRASANL